MTDENDTGIDEVTAGEYITAVYLLLRNRMAGTAPLRDLVERMSSEEGIGFLGSVLAGVAYAAAVDYRSSRDLPEDEDLFLQEELDCWEGSRDDYPDYYTHCLQFINAAVNRDGLAASSVWSTCITATSDVDEDVKLLTRLVGDLQHLIDHALHPGSVHE
jgi:hypothetical protein